MPKKPDFTRNLAEIVAAGSTVRDAAEQLGVPEKAAYTQSASAEFKALVHQIKTERTESLAGMVLTAAQEAVISLQVMASAAEKDSDRIAAAKAILQYVIPLSENTELRRRIEELERRASEKAEQPREITRMDGA